MKKIAAYEKTEFKSDFSDENKNICEITLIITNENEEHLKKCLNDPAFINSLVKISNKKEPKRIRIKVGLVNLYKEK